MTKDCSMYTFIKNNNPDSTRAAMYFEGKKFTFSALFKEIDAVAAFIDGLGIKKGDSVTISLPNVPSTVALIYACSKLGVIANLVHPLEPIAQLKHYSEQTGSKALFVFDKTINRNFDKLSDVNVPIIVCNAQTHLSWLKAKLLNLISHHHRNNIKYVNNVYHYADVLKASSATESVAEGSDIACIMHSGGTVAMPKSIVLSNKSFNAIADNTIKVIGDVNHNDIMLGVLPTFHAFGLGVCFHTVISYGIAVYLVPQFSAKLINRIVKNKRVTLLAGVPSMYSSMMKASNFNGNYLKRLKFAFCGGDILNPKVKEDFEKAVNNYGGTCTLDEGYGLTEMCGVFSVNRKSASKVGSVGQPLGDYEAKVFIGGIQQDADVEGELCLTGESLMLGYYDDKETTKLALFEHNNKTWLHTGDYGHIDSDGYIFFKQRVKRIIKVSGIPVFPAEIEKVISSIDGVDNACVVAVTDVRKGHIPVAYVVAKNTSEGLEQRIVSQCCEQLNKWSQPRKIIFVESLPMTKLGKVDVNIVSKWNEN